jgi:hypothetical protein
VTPHSAPDGTASAASPRWLARLEVALLAAGLALLLFSPASLDGDALVRFEALDDLLARGRVSSTPYSLVGPLASAPLWLLGRLGGSPAWGCLLYNRLLFIGGLLVLGRLLGDVAAELRRRFLLLLVLASMFPHHVQYYYSEVFSAVLAAVGLLAVARGRALAGWTGVVLAVVNNPAWAGGLTLAAGCVMVRTRRWRHALVLLVTAALVVLESWLRRGHPLMSGYEDNHGFATVLPYSGRPGFSYPLFFGLLSIVLSFGKGLVFFAPGLLLPVPRHAVAPVVRAAWLLWLAFLAGLVLVYARWWAWYGGWFWGPRFFLFASVPASLALAVHLGAADQRALGWNLLALAALLLSLWVGLNGLVFGQAGLEVCAADYSLEFLTWYVPEFSALWRPFVAPRLPADLGGWAVLGAALAVYALAVVVLTGPLAALCARQGVRRLAGWWAKQPEGQRWRF